MPATLDTETRSPLEQLDDYVTETLDEIERLLPPLPAATLRLQRSMAERTQKAFEDVTRAVFSSCSAIARSSSTATKTVVGTARWATERTVDTATVAAKTVAGQARAQAEQTAETIGDEIDDVTSEIGAVAERVETAAAEAADAASDEISPSGRNARDLSTWTKAELYDRAQALDIAGRSSMDKAELIAALEASS